MTIKIPYSFFLILFTVSPVLAAVTITDIEPTIFFPRQPNDQELRQLYRIHVANDSGQEMTVKIRFSVPGQTVVEEDQTIKTNTDNMEIAIPEISSPTEAKCEIWDAAGELLDSKQIPVVPQKKRKIFCAAVSHQDLGFIDYYQRVRRHVRENGIEKALECCRLTDDWPEDSRFRWTIETSEPVLRFINRYPPAMVAEFVRRIREGRIEPSQPRWPVMKYWPDPFIIPIDI